jgi:Fe-S cluster assembly protein SufD
MNAVSPLEIFRAQGIPHRRVEEWKYSDLRSAIDAETFEHTYGVVMVVNNPSAQIETVINDELPDWASSAVQGLGVGGAMDAAAKAFSPNVVAIRVPGGLQIVDPLHIEFHAEGQGQIILCLEKGASLSFVETHHPDSEGLRNISLSILLESDTKLTHIRREHFAKTSVTVETMGVQVAKSAQYLAHFTSLGAKLSRTELNVMLVGEGADANISGVSVLADGAHADVTTRIDHRTGHTQSTQLFKAVAGGKSRAVYQGKITVSEGADVSDSRQTAKGLLLGPRAEIDLKPELEIFADDVKCAHGAAVGDLDVESLFYLRSRGVPEAEARVLLIRGFLEEAVEGIAREDTRAETWQLVEQGLARATETAS